MKKTSYQNSKFFGPIIGSSTMIFYTVLVLLANTEHDISISGAFINKRDPYLKGIIHLVFSIDY